MKKHITRRQAAKAVALGTDAAFVAPAALADSNPDAEILALARELERIETEVIPPLTAEFNEAEEKVLNAVPHQKPPRYTLAQIEKHQASMAETLSEDTNGDATTALVLTKATQLLFQKEYGDMDPKAMAAEHFAADREAAQQYEDFCKARLQAENETGLHEKEQRMYRAHDDADAIREKICTIPARTEAGYLAKLKIVMHGKHPDTLASPEYVDDKAVVSLMRDLKAGA